MRRHQIDDPLENARAALAADITHVRSIAESGAAVKGLRSDYMALSLNPPPKFIKGPQAPGPSNEYEWDQLFRWFLGMYGVVQVAATVPQTINPTPSPIPNPNDTVAFGRALSPTPAQPSPGLDTAQAQGLERRAGSAPEDVLTDLVASLNLARGDRRLGDDLTGLVAVLFRPPYPFQGGGGGLVLIDSHANRLANYAAANYQVGQLFLENDRGYMYIVESLAGTNNTWVYVAGLYSDLLANIPTDLGTHDKNALFAGTDYQHTWRWHGAAWHFLEGDGSGYNILTNADTMGGVFVPADGGVHTISTDAGGTTFITTTNLTGSTIDTTAGPLAVTFSTRA